MREEVKRGKVSGVAPAGAGNTAQAARTMREEMVNGVKICFVKLIHYIYALKI